MYVCVLYVSSSVALMVVCGIIDHVIIQPTQTSDTVRPLSALLRSLPLHCSRLRSTAAASALLRPLSALLRPLYVGVRLCSEHVPQRSALMGHL